MPTVLLDFLVSNGASVNMIIEENRISPFSSVQFPIDKMYMYRLKEKLKAMSGLNVPLAISVSADDINKTKFFID